MGKFFSGECIPPLRVNCIKCRLQIAGNVLVVAIPHAAPTEQPFTLFDVDHAVLTSPIVDVPKQIAVDIT